MGKTYEEVIKEYKSLCHECAVSLGGKPTDGNTLYMGDCSKCGKHTHMGSIGDYIWKGEKDVPVGRWD